VGRVGVVVNGDDVTMYGLMVEHYQEYQTIWNGERGFMCFYQSETPYDAPNQAVWTNPAFPGNTGQGWASYKIGDNVQEHTALGVGVYYVSNTPTVVKMLNHGIESPSNSGITIKNMVCARFDGGVSNSSGFRSILYLTDKGTQHGAGSSASGGKTYLKSLENGVVSNW
jgi:hypothetical protein